MLVNFELRYYEDEIKLMYKEYCDLQNIIHWHKEHELIYVKRGSAKIGVNKETFIAQAGDLIICDSGDMHYINSIEKGTICDILIFDSDYLQPLLSKLCLLPTYIRNEIVREKNLDVQHLFNSISKELHCRDIFSNEMIRTYLMRFYISCFRELEYNDKPFQHSRNKILMESYQNLLEYIDRHHADIDFIECAKFMGFTPPYFSKIFKEISGMTFTDYLNYVKVEKAVSLLQKTDLTVTAVAEMCGFNNIRSFNRVFKKVTGLTPTNIGPEYQFPHNYLPKRNVDNMFNPTVSETIIDGHDQE